MHRARPTPEHLRRGACTSPSRCEPRDASRRSGTSDTWRTAETREPSALSPERRAICVRRADRHAAADESTLVWSARSRPAKHRERPAGEMISAERVMEARMRRAGIGEAGPAELADVAQPLQDGRIDESEGDLVVEDVV